MILKGKEYRHYNNRRVYVVIDILPYKSQYKGEWYPTVLYKEKNGTGLYLRAYREFEEKFEENFSNLT